MALFIEQHDQPLNVNVFVSFSSGRLDDFKSNYSRHQSIR